LQDVLKPHAQFSPGASQVIIGGDRSGTTVYDPHLEVILKILTDLRPVTQHFDSVSPQKIGITNSGKLQELRGLRCARAEQDLAPSTHLLLLTAVKVEQRIGPAT
jgi:hypothetical protein